MQMTLEESLDRAKKVLESSDRIVALLGVGVVMECGALNYLNNQVIYRIEDTYNHSPRDFSVPAQNVFFNIIRRNIWPIVASPMKPLKH